MAEQDYAPVQTSSSLEVDSTLVLPTTQAAPRQETRRFGAMFAAMAVVLVGSGFWLGEKSRSAPTPTLSPPAAATPSTGSWSDWDACIPHNMACGSGTQSRTCSSTAGGDACAGEHVRPCDMPACPSSAPHGSQSESVQSGHSAQAASSQQHQPGAKAAAPTAAAAPTQEEKANVRLQQLKEKLKPRGLVHKGNDGPMRQFAHLHHMKTGGTSINHVIQCGLKRERSMLPPTQSIPFFSVSECAYSFFQKCIAGTAGNCSARADSSMIMQYCAPLSAVTHFGWLEADLVTMIRHPVDRVWSMYRFRTKGCYKCMTLKEVYGHIDNNTTDQVCGTCQSICMSQISNHLTRNLLTTALDEELHGEEMLAEAIDNLHNTVTLVGLTNELPATHQMIGKVFTWLNQTVKGSETECILPHSNGSPSNNGCGAKGADGRSTHMDLPDEPDEETKQLILQHNQLDLKLYESAKRLFDLQKLALGVSL